MGSSLIQTFIVYGKLPTLNELIDAKARQGRRGRSGARVDAYSQLKLEWTDAVAWAVKANRVKPVTGRSWFRIVYLRENRRTDPDNISAGARKMILDGLVKAGVLPNDGWAQVAGFAERFMLSEVTATQVTIETEG